MNKTDYKDFIVVVRQNRINVTFNKTHVIDHPVLERHIKPLSPFKLQFFFLLKYPISTMIERLLVNLLHLYSRRKRSEKVVVCTVFCTDHERTGFKCLCPTNSGRNWNSGTPHSNSGARSSVHVDGECPGCRSWSLRVTGKPDCHRIRPLG
jgi:hypothetical protein